MSMNGGERLIPASEYFGASPMEQPLEEMHAYERRAGYPEGAIDNILTEWQSLLPNAQTAADALRQADTAVIFWSRNIAAIAVRETLKALQAAGYAVPKPAEDGTAER